MASARSSEREASAMSNERSGWRVVSSAAASQASARSREREEPRARGPEEPRARGAASARSREREEPRARGEREEQRARRERDEQRARGVASGVVGGGDTTSPPSAWIVPSGERPLRPGGLASPPEFRQAKLAGDGNTPLRGGHPCGFTDSPDSGERPLLACAGSRGSTGFRQAELAGDGNT